jgi:glutathione synthase
VTVQRVAGDHFTRGEQVRLDLGKDIDVVLMRQDPPFHMGYITATHMLERIAAETLVVNDPANVRNSPEKVMVLNYRRFMPPTLVTRSVDEVRRFMAKHGAIVVKPRKPHRVVRGVQPDLARTAHGAALPPRSRQG